MHGADRGPSRCNQFMVWTPPLTPYNRGKEPDSFPKRHFGNSLLRPCEAGQKILVCYVLHPPEFTATTFTAWENPCLLVEA